MKLTTTNSAFYDKYTGQSFPGAAYVKGFLAGAKELDRETGGMLSRYAKSQLNKAKGTAVQVLKDKISGSKTPRLTRIKRPLDSVQLKIVPPSLSGAVTSSYYRAKGRKFRKYMKDAVKTATPVVYTNIITGSWTTNTGVQFNATSCVWQSTPLKYRVFNLALNGAVTDTVAVADYNKRVLINKYWQSLMITNYDISTCFLEIYVMKPRDYMSISPTEVWTNAATGGSGSDYVTSGSPKMPFTSPWSCRSLLQEYKILKKYKIELQQGCTHKFTAVIKMNTMKTGREISDDGLAFTNDCRAFLILANGTPVHDNNNPLIVSTSKVKLDVVGTYGAMATVVGTTTSTNSINGALTSIVNEATLSVGSGAVAAD